MGGAVLSSAGTRRIAGRGEPHRLLVVSPFPPRRDGFHGGARAIAHFLHRLAVRHEIALLCLRASAEPPIDEQLVTELAHVEEIVYPGGASANGPIRGLVRDYAGLLRGTPSWVRGLRSIEFARALRDLDLAWRPDIIQFEYSVMGQYVTALPDLRAPRVLVEHDLAIEAASELWRRKRGTARLRAGVELLAWKNFESRLMEQVDVVVVFTDRDADAVRGFFADARVKVVPLGAEVPTRPLNPRGGSPPTLLFVGSFVHTPNVDAAVRLARDIFPRLRDTFPELMLNLVGHAPTSEVRALVAPRIAVHGDVPDVTPYVEQAAVFVAPLGLGGGMRIKVLEALAAGKAVVASPRAVEGICAVPGEHLLLAESDEEFAAAVAQLVRDPARRSAIGEAAHAWAREHLSWDRSASLFERLYDSLIPSGEAAARRT